MKIREGRRNFMTELKKFKMELLHNELSQATLNRYLTDITQFIEKENIESIKDITKSKVLDYKSFLINNFKTSTCTIKLVAINKFLDFLGLQSFKVKLPKQLKKKVLEDLITVAEYERLLKYAKKLDKVKMYYIILTLANTGIRISELEFITVEALKKESTVIKNKGKIREIILPKKLTKDLKEYCKKNGIIKGAVFISKFYRPMGVTYIHKELKFISGQARIKKSKVHAHAFRHLFAVQYMKKNNNALSLADILGHSSLETTRIYTQQTKKQHQKSIDDLFLN